MRRTVRLRVHTAAAVPAKTANKPPIRICALMRDLSQHRYLLQATLSPMYLEESTLHPGALRSDDAKYAEFGSFYTKRSSMTYSFKQLIGATNLIPPVSTSSLAAGRHNRKDQLDR